MNTLALGGFWYCDAKPDGRYVAARFDAPFVDLNHGMVGGHQLQWVRLGHGGRFAGTGANDDHAWEWDGTTYQDCGRFVAPRAVLYRADGTLFVERTGAWPGSGSQGWRYVDDNGQSIEAWRTYADASRQIYEYTTRRDVTIGQGNGGVVALVTGKRIRLDPLVADFGEAPACFAVNFARNGNLYAVSWYVAHSPTSYTACFVWLTDAELRALPDSTPPPPLPIGPRSEPRPADGRVYDLAPFILGAESLWPRSGPTHPQHQYVAGELFHFIKFGNPQAYETWALDEDWSYHLEDASGQTYSFTDPRWFPRRLPIGEAHAFDTGPHEAVFRERNTCGEQHRDPFRRRMWLHALWDAWYWGPDLGQRATVQLVYDATANIHTADRIVEVLYFAYGAGWSRWEAYRSDLVYANGAAQFPDDARTARSDFYLLGGPALMPELTYCVPQACPHWPPLDSPVETGVFMVDPKTVIVYKSLKPSTERPSCTNIILFDDTVFSCQADGSPGTRPSGTDGPWEQAQITGSLATFSSGGKHYAFGLAPGDKLP